MDRALATKIIGNPLRECGAVKAPIPNRCPLSEGAITCCPCVKSEYRVLPFDEFADQKSLREQYNKI